MGWKEVSTGLAFELGAVSGRDSLLRSLVDSGEAQDHGEVVHIAHHVVAGLSADEASVLTLPEPLSFTLQIRCTEAVHRPDALLKLDWFEFGKRQWMTERRGALAHFDGGHVFRLTSPLYELFEAAARYNEGAGREAATDRMVQWAKVSACLPEGAGIMLDAHLDRIVVHVFSTFSIEPKLTSTGDPDFDVVPGSWRISSELGDTVEERTFAAALPEALNEQFNQQLRRGRPKRSYTVASGNYVIPTADVSKALTVLHSVRASGPAAVREFLKQPHATLRERLTDQSPELAQDLDDVYSELSYYGDRVRGIGLWEPKVLPWISRPSEPWLPPEKFGVDISGKRVEIDPEDVAELAGAVRQAIEVGTPAVEYNGHSIPANEDVLATISSLPGLIRPDGDSRLGGGAERARPTGRRVLQVASNLDVAEYVRIRRGVERSSQVDVGKRMHATLYPHQHEALKWLQKAWQAGEPGVLLADDMGLGKTLQTLAFLAWIKALSLTGDIPARPILVVAPTGLLRNWVQEHDLHLEGDGLGRRLEAFGTSLRDLKLGSPDAEGGSALALDLSRLSTAGWVLTSYETYRDYQLSFGRVEWNVTVFDEVQKIKNPAAALTEAARSINTEFVISLSGTPVENRLADLWSIMDVTRPGLLGSLKDFSREWEQQGADLGGLREILTSGQPPAMLRRVKEDHLEGLPSRQLIFARNEMPEAQRSAYEEAIGLARSVRPGGMIEALGRMRSISLHPHARGPEALSDYISRSGRLTLTVRWLQDIKSKGEKALVFAESRAIQAVLAEIATELLGLNHRPLLINGQIAGPERQKRVNQFQDGGDGFDLMILSPKAGGVGLTLTAANHVIHLSRWWNPAVEDQCTDRVYRLKQTRPVHVYHPLAEHPQFGIHSFDLRLEDLLREKRLISRAALAPASATSDDFDRLFQDVITERSIDDSGIDLPMIDALDGIGFQDWVLTQLRTAGYTVSNTPHSHDKGVDLVAEWRSRPTLLVQCKHTQVGTALSQDAIDEVINGARHYSDRKDVTLLVVTNSGHMSSATQEFAFTKGVQVWLRPHLGGLASTRVYLGPRLALS